MKILKSAVLTATLGVFSLPALAVPMTGDSFDVVLTADIIDNCNTFACGGTSDGSGTFTLGAEITAGSLMGNFELSAYIFLINAVTYDSSVRLDFLSYNPSTGNIVGVALIPLQGNTFRALTFDDSGEYVNQVNQAVITRGHQSSTLITTGDADSDGVVDDDDLCPDTAPNDQVDTDGCSDAQLDTDNDGASDADDNCPNTVIPESLPTRSLGVNRFALVDGDGDFDTTPPNGVGPRRSYTTADTAGCSCTQIIEALGLGDGHAKFGCSISAMDDWVELVNP